MGTPCGAVASSCRRGSSQVRPRPSPWPRSWALLPPPVPAWRGRALTMDCLDLLAVQGTLKCLLQHHSSKASRPDTGVELHRLGAALVPPVKLSRFTGDASSLVCREFQSQKSFPSGVCSVSSGRLLCPSVPQVPSRKAGKRSAGHQHPEPRVRLPER